MSAPQPIPGVTVRFGIFELNLDTGELRKGGLPIRLAPQPAQILCLLVSRAGELVSREEIRETVWGKETFGDFEHGLNHCIKQIRTALGDEADTGLYIETLRRRGYRFVAPVSLPPATPDPLPESPETALPASPLPSPARRPVWLRWALPGAAIVVAAGLIFALRPSGGAPPALRKFTFQPPQRMTISSYNTDSGLSPSGRYFGYRGDDWLWLHDLERGETRRVESTRETLELYWAAHGRRLVYQQDRTLKSISPEGGTSSTLLVLPSTQVWCFSESPDGKTNVFCEGKPPSLYEIPATGGTPRLLLRAGVERGKPGEYYGGIHAARFLPAEAGPRVVVFATGTQRDPVLQVLDLTTRKGQSLGRGTLPVYSPTGHLIYQEGGNHYSLWAMPFSLKKLTPTGRPFKIAAHGRDPTVAEDGTLAYVEAPSSTWRLVWRDRQGRHLGYATGPTPVAWPPELSPDNRFVLSSVGPDTNYRDLWIQDLAHNTGNSLTNAVDSFLDVWAPVWSPDGKRFAYSVFGKGVFIRTPEEAGLGTLIHAFDERAIYLDWSRDGRRILMTVIRPDTNHDLLALEDPGTGGLWRVTPYLVEKGNQRAARFSPDGRFVAYMSDESGQREIYVQPFPKPGKRWTVSVGGGEMPRWRRDGRELFYLDPAQNIVAVPVSTGDSFVAGPPRVLFAASRTEPFVINRCIYDVSADGARFLVAEPMSEFRPPRIWFIQNWHLEFSSRQGN